MSIQKLFFVSVVFSLLLLAKSYEENSVNSTRNIKLKIKNKFHLPQNIDYKNTLKRDKKRPKKIKKDRGTIASIYQ